MKKVVDQSPLKKEKKKKIDEVGVQKGSNHIINPRLQRFLRLRKHLPVQLLGPGPPGWNGRLPRVKKMMELCVSPPVCAQRREGGREKKKKTARWRRREEEKRYERQVRTSIRRRSR